MRQTGLIDESGGKRRFLRSVVVGCGREKLGRKEREGGRNKKMGMATFFGDDNNSLFFFWRTRWPEKGEWENRGTDFSYARWEGGGRHQRDTGDGERERVRKGNL